MNPAGGRTANEESPALVVAREELAGLDASPGTMIDIPGSRMFEIRDALSVYHRDFPGGEEFDASQGDGGASLPGVSEEVWDAAHELQKKHGSGYDQPFGTAAFRKSVVEQYWGLDAVLAQVRNLPQAADGRKIPFELINENPLFGLPKLMAGIAARKTRISRINLTMRADWMLRGEKSACPPSQAKGLWFLPSQ